MPLKKKSYGYLMPLLIRIPLSLPSPPGPCIFAPSSSPNISKAGGITAFEKPQASDPLYDIVSKNPNPRSWIFVVGHLLKRGQDSR